LALAITIKQDVEIIGVQDESCNNVVCLLRDYYYGNVYHRMARKIDLMRKSLGEQG
jgi:hypothetical protein